MDVLAAIPKLDLHVHLIGSVRPATLAELAAGAGIPLPAPASGLYRRINSHPTEDEERDGPWFPLLRIYELICSCLQTEDDFARVAYEALEDGLRSSGVVYQELAFSPSVHMALGVPYPTVARGLARGVRAARRDMGVDGALIAAVNREDTAAAAAEMASAVAEFPLEEVVAIGIDFDERLGPPQKFREAFMIAERAGLHRTAHAAEHVPGGEYLRYCLDTLHCERIDHGYYVLDDDALVSRCRDEGIVFNVAFTTSRRKLRPWRRSSVKAMVDRGLRVTINSDDPALFPTTVAEEMRIAVSSAGLTVPQVFSAIDNSIDAAFLDASAKKSLRARVSSVAG
jgi:adenosine deaminase